MASLIQTTIPCYSDVPRLYFKNPSLKNLEFPKRVLFNTKKRNICKSSLDEVAAVEPPPKLDDKSKAELIGSLKFKLLVRSSFYIILV